MTTELTCVDVQAFAPQSKFPRISTPTPGLVAQNRSADELLRQGSELLGIGKYEEARTVFEQVVKLMPNSFSAWYWRGYTLSKLGRYQDAIASFGQAIQFQPNKNETLLRSN